MFRGAVTALSLVASCTRHGPPAAASPAPVAPYVAAPATVPTARASATAVEGSSSASEGQDLGAAPHGPYKRVLQIGDSTVGWQGGLSKALERRFHAEGSKFLSEAVTSASIANFDTSERYQGLLAKYKPDLVLITLGANDVFIPHPATLSGNVMKIAKRAADGGPDVQPGPHKKSDCYWIGPPTWKKDTGIVEVIRQNSRPCKFFDSSDLTLKRRGDGIHPTDEGGETWGALFWAFFKGDAAAALTSR